MTGPETTTCGECGARAVFIGHDPRIHKASCPRTNVTKEEPS